MEMRSTFDLTSSFFKKSKDTQSALSVSSGHNHHKHGVYGASNRPLSSSRSAAALGPADDVDADATGGGDTEMVELGAANPLHSPTSSDTGAATKRKSAFAELDEVYASLEDDLDYGGDLAQFTSFMDVNPMHTEDNAPIDFVEMRESESSQA